MGGVLEHGDAYNMSWRGLYHLGGLEEAHQQKTTSRGVRMSTTQEATVARICESFANDGSRMMDIVLAVQEQFGCVDGAAM